MSKWRPKEGWNNPHAPDKGGCQHARIYEAGADALLEAEEPLLQQVYTHLCAYSISVTQMSWRRASLDNSLKGLRAILGIPDEEERGG